MAKTCETSAAEIIPLNPLMRMMAPISITVHFVHQCFHPSDVVIGQFEASRYRNICQWLFVNGFLIAPYQYVYFRQKQSSTKHPFVHQNTDEETSGYLTQSDRMSPVMWTKQIPHPPQFHHLQQHPHAHQPKDYSNYIYPSSGDELVPELEDMKIEERRRIQKHRAPPVCDTDDNGHETDFTMPK